MRRDTARASRISRCLSKGISREHTTGARSDAASCAHGAACSRSSRWRTLLGAITVALALGGLTSLLAGSAAAAAVGPAFSCQSEIDFLTQSHADGEATKFYESEFKSGEVVYNEVNSKSASSSYNALGYDPTNNYLYSTQLNVAPLGTGTVGTLFQIDNTGTATSRGIIEGYPAESGGPADGAFDPSGNYWITGGNGSTKAFEINVTSSPAKVIKTVTLSQAWKPIDWTYYEGYMWGLAETNIYRVNLSTGTVNTFAAPSGVESGAYGAAWTFSNGNLGFSNNDSGAIYKLEVQTPATPKFTLLAHYIGPKADASNDGAACIAKEKVDLEIVKTAPAVVLPGGAVTWTLTVTNKGPGKSSGFSVGDKVPSGFTNVKTTTSGCSVVGNAVTCAEGQLAVGGTFIITLTGNAPSTAQCLTNEATVVGDEEDPELANNKSSAQTCTEPAKLGVKKTDNLNPLEFETVGTVVTYTITATNETANITLHEVSVSDSPALAGFKCAPAIPVGELAPGKSIVCTGTHTITQEDLDVGSFKDVASATSKEVAGGPAEDTITGKQRPKLGLTKTDNLNPAKYDKVGQVVKYTLKATNEGNTTLHEVTVSDSPSLEGFVCVPSIPVASLAPGASITCMGSHTITQEDLNNGSFKDTASATSKEATAPNAEDTVTAEQKPKLGLTKTDNLNPAKYNKVGQVVKYTLKATNEGNTTLHEVTVSDSPSLEGFVCVPSIPVASLAPGASVECTGTHTITQEDLNNGSFTDTGSASSKEASAPNAEDTVTAEQKPKLGLTKTDNLNPAKYNKVGQVVKYTLKATNEGNTTLHDVSVSDSPSLEGFSCTPAIPVASLAPGASVECTGTHTITQEDLNNGSFKDTASATSKEATAPNAEDTVTAEQKPVLGLTKTDNLNPAKYDKVGQVVKYTLKATNEGNTTLHDVSVSDSPSLEGFVCVPSIPVASLAPGASITCMGSHTITQEDLDNGSFKDTASATSKEATAPNAEDTVTAEQKPKLGLTKTDNLNPAKYDKVGQVVKYTLKATNEGNTTLHEVTVSDSPSLEGFVCVPSIPVASLAPGASITCMGSHTITQEDLNNGSFKDTASATSKEATAPNAEDTVTAEQKPVLGLTKTDNLNPAKYDKVGQVVKYTLVATNEGNTTLHDVSVSDSPSLEGFSCTPAIPVASLAPGASVECTGTHTITQEDLNNGSFTDTGSASSKEATAPDAKDTITGEQKPKLGLTKTDNLNPAKYNKVGQVVKYTLVATNEGNTTLHDVSVSDSPSLEGFSCTPAIPVASLAPGASVECTGTHTITQEDLNNGSFTDTGSASSKEATAPDAKDTITGEQKPKLGLTKTDNLNPAKYNKVGQVVKYTLVATNEGNTTLHDVSVSDSPSLEGFSCTPAIPVASLAPGASVECTGTHTITQEDLNNGSFTDTGSASSKEATAPDAKDTITGEQKPKLGLTKTDNLNPAKYNKVGQVVKYTLVATNEGNTTLHDVSVSDSPSLEGFSCTPAIPVASLAPGASVECTGTHTITQEDLNNGSFTDTGSATSKEADAPNAEDMITSEQKPALGVTKADNLNPGKYESVGQVVKYTLVATNEGNTTLHEVSVSDSPALEGFSCAPVIPVASLAPGASITCTGTHTITQEDLNNGFFKDIGSATSKEANAPNAEDTITAEQKRSLVVEKEQELKGSGAGFTKGKVVAKLGDTVVYLIKVTNTGNVSVQLAKLTDANCTNLVGPGKAELAPTESTTYTCEHQLTTAGLYTNQAEVETEKGGKATSNKVELEVEAPAQIVQAACTIDEPAIVLRGVSGAKSKPFTAHISALGIKELTFYVDGRKIKTLKAANAKNGVFSVKIDPRKLKYGAHKVSVKAVMTDGACAAIARKAVFVHPRPAKVKPTFTG